MKETKKSTRRDLMKKVGITTAFAIPTITTFRIKDLRAGVSGGPAPQLPNEPGLPECP